MAFGATIVHCIGVIFGDYKAILGKELDAVRQRPSTPGWTTVFFKILAIIVIATAYYPLFALIKYRFKLIGALLGSLFSLFWLGFAIKSAVTVWVCQKVMIFAILEIAYRLPAKICLFGVLMKFMIKFLIEVKAVWKQKRFKDLIDDKSITWHQHYMYQHVKFIFKSQKSISSEESVDHKSNSVPTNIKKKLYTPDPDFRYSTRIVCSFVVSFLAVYETCLLLVAIIYLLFEVITEPFLLKDDTAEFLGHYNLSEELDLLRDYAKIMRISGYVSAALSVTILVAVLLNMLSWYRGHILKLRKGDRSWLPNSLASLSANPVSLTAASMKFAGYQVAHTVWGAVVVSIIIWILLIILGSQIILPIKRKELSFLLVLLRNIWPAVLISVIIKIFQTLAAKYFFLEGRGNSFSIINRNAFHITSYFLFYFNVALGLITCLLRIIKGLVVGVIFLPRLQKSILPRSYERQDPGYMTYVGYVILEHTHCNPILTVFFGHLQEEMETRRKLKQRFGSFTPASDKNHIEVKGTSELVEFTGVSNTNELVKACKTSRNRWHLAYTLIKNPTLQFYRSHAVTQKRQSILQGVKSYAYRQQLLKEGESMHVAQLVFKTSV